MDAGPAAPPGGRNDTSTEEISGIKSFILKEPYNTDIYMHVDACMHVQVEGQIEHHEGVLQLHPSVQMFPQIDTLLARDTFKTGKDSFFFLQGKNA